MQVIQQITPVGTPLPGVDHATWAGSADGLAQLSVWRQSLAPGAMTPPHSHDCDEVVLCLGGSGEVHAAGSVRSFSANATIVLPRGEAHQILNTGSERLEIVGVFGATPVGTFLPDGAAIELPWAT